MCDIFFFPSKIFVIKYWESKIKGLFQIGSGFKMSNIGSISQPGYATLLPNTWKMVLNSMYRY